MSETTNPGWMPDAPLLLTKEQTARLLNVSVRTIGNLLARRELVRRKIGTRTLIPRTSIDAFLRKDHQTQ
ncbi:MAG: helix-turn-helix domain-containing protein [Candidatus Acidiferrales bacterium]|jgi:excisionase family DNA binding protein